MPIFAGSIYESPGKYSFAGILPTLGTTISYDMWSDNSDLSFLPLPYHDIVKLGRIASMIARTDP